MTFEERKLALKKNLVHEYKSFFRPFRGGSYHEDMSFRDPMTSIQGKNFYRFMNEVLGGSNALGGALFGDGFIDMHAIEDVDEYNFRTRWTAGFKLKAMPWSPMLLFTGVSEYTIDESAKVVAQRDYWDTTNLGDDGQYVHEGLLGGPGDLAEQMLPPFVRRGAEPELVHSGTWTLLRRAPKYRVYRSQDGTVFAIGHPDAAASEWAEVSEAVREHGLVPGERLRVQLTGAGDVMLDDGIVKDDETVLGLELLEPHPWDGTKAPPAADE